MTNIARELKRITDLVISTMTGFPKLDPFVFVLKRSPYSRPILLMSSNLVVHSFFKLGHVGQPKETNSLVFTTVIVFFAGGGDLPKHSYCGANSFKLCSDYQAYYIYIVFEEFYFVLYYLKKNVSWLICVMLAYIGFT